MFVNLGSSVCAWRDFVILAGSKRGREEDNEENRPETLHTTSTIKKSRLDPAASLQVNILLCRCLHVLNKVMINPKCLHGDYICNNFHSALWYHVCFVSLGKEFCGCVQGIFSLVILVRLQKCLEINGTICLSETCFVVVRVRGYIRLFLHLDYDYSHSLYTL